MLTFLSFFRSELNCANKGVAFAPIEMVDLDSEEEELNQLPGAMEEFDAELETIELDSINEMDTVSEKDLPVPVVRCEIENR